MKKKYLYFTLNELIDNHIHIGHHKKFRKNQTSTLLFGVRKSICIFDLKRTLFYYKRAITLLKHYSFNYASMLFVGIYPEVSFFIKKLSKLYNCPYHIKVWVGGLISNWKEIVTFACRATPLSFDRGLNRFTLRQEKVKIKKYNQYLKLRKAIKGVTSCPAPPSLIIVLNSFACHSAV